MNENMRQRDDTIRKKDEKIRELTFQVNILQQELRLKNQRLAQGFGLDSNSNAHSSRNTIVISQDDNFVAPPSSTVTTGTEKSRPKRTALVERTNSLTHDATASGETSKKSVKIADSVSNHAADANGIAAHNDQAVKSAAIDV